MRAASLPIQRPPNARLLAADSNGRIRHLARSQFADLLRPGDLLVANDAATLPASLRGRHSPTGRVIEVRLAGRDTLAETLRFSAVVFGEGDFRIRTEDRPHPPRLKAGDRITFGSLTCRIERLLDHPRFIKIRFEGPVERVREYLARHGRPIQYAHVPTPLEIWDSWTPIAGPPVAFEPPSAGFILNWRALGELRARGIAFATITHSAGISSTGDAELDALLPFQEPYRIPDATARAIEHARAGGGRIVAVGTTVVRALEHAAEGGGLQPGDRLATQKIGQATTLQVVNAILSGTHERGSSHYELLRAFADDRTLEEMDEELRVHGYRTHEYGDSVYVARRVGRSASASGFSPQ